MTLLFALRLLRLRALQLRKIGGKVAKKAKVGASKLKFSSIKKRIVFVRTHTQNNKYQICNLYQQTKYNYNTSQRRLLLGLASASLSTFGVGITNILADNTEEEQSLDEIINPYGEDPLKLLKNQSKQLDWGWQIPRKHPDKPPVMVLVVDGGGLRGAMTTQILKELETEVKRLDPKLELKLCFDYVIGTSTGGLIALGISKLDWDCDRIDDFYDLLGQNVFRTEKKWYDPRRYIDSIKAAGSYTGLNTSLDTKKLEKFFKEVIDPQEKMREVSTAYNDEPYTAVVGTLTSNFTLPAPIIFRNYDITDSGYTVFGESNEYFLPGISDCKIWEAARATSAAPTYFEPVTLKAPQKMRHKMIIYQFRQLFSDCKENSKLTTVQKNTIADFVADGIDSNEKPDKICDKIEEYANSFENSKDLKCLKKRKRIKAICKFDYSLQVVDGGIISNAPILFAFTEVKALWPDQDVCILALGTGKQSKLNLFNHNKASVYIQTLFQNVFGAKESATLLPVVSISSSGAFRLTRWNPTIDMKYEDMAFYGNMPYYRKRGKKFGKKVKKNGSVQFWAQILVNHAQNGEVKKNVEEYQRRKETYRESREKIRHKKQKKL